jgi:hypothetical protein
LLFAGIIGSSAINGLLPANHSVENSDVVEDSESALESGDGVLDITDQNLVETPGKVSNHYNCYF